MQINSRDFSVGDMTARRRFYFRGDEFAVDQFIFRATIVYQATKNFQGNQYDREESGWPVDDYRQTVQLESS